MRVGLGYIFTVLVALSGAVLGCSLSLSAPAPSSSDNFADGGNSGTPPTVSIQDPADGAVVPVGQRVDLTVQTDVAADRFTLTVNGTVVSTKALPPDQSGGTAAILGWTPQYEGTYTLEVVAYHGVVAGPPATLQLQVAGTGNNTSSTASSCMGRVLVSQLNFRDGPGTNYTQLGRFQVGETVTVLGTDAARTWLKAQRVLNGQQVWVINKSQWLQLEGPCMNLPVLG